MNTTISRAVFSTVLAAGLLGCPTAPQPDPIPPSPKVASFSATPAAIAPGDKVTLAWEVTDATTVTIADVSRGDVSGVDNKLSGSVMVTPGASTLFVLTALNARGAKATAVASVTVAGADATKLLFAAYPATISAGASGTLVWSAPGAKSVTITPMGGMPLDLKGQVTAGSVEVSPTAAETTYTLSADGSTRTVSVKREVELTELTTSKKLAKPGDMVTVSWKSRFGTKATLSSPGRGELSTTMDAAQVAMGSFTDTVPTVPNGTALNYVLDVQGPGGTTRDSVVVVVGLDPVLTEATAPKYAKTGGNFAIGWKSTNADAVQVRSGTTVLYQTTTVAETNAGTLNLPTPMATTTYTVAAISLASGMASTKDVTVEPVGTASVMTFTANPTMLTTGAAPVTLTWNVPNARQLRIVQDGELTVVALKGQAAEMGTTTVYPNRASTQFVLTADNTIEPQVTANATVTASSLQELALADGGVIFEGQGAIDVASPVGTELQGLAHADVVSAMMSGGFDDISMTGEKLTFTNPDDGTATFTPFGFETFLYGARLAPASFAVATNGILGLGGTITSTGTPPTTFPNTTSPTNLAAVYWADLELGANGNVYWQVKGSAPNQVLIVQWDKLRVKGAMTSVVTFQAQVTQMGVVTYEYKTLDNLPAINTVITGIQGTGGVGLAGVAVAGGSVKFFGPKPFPFAWQSSRLPLTAFAKIGSGFARITLSKFIRATDFAISEVMYAPAAAVPAGEWFEVRNVSPTAIDLNGWVIDFGGGQTHTIASSVVVPAGGLVVLGQSTDTMQNDGVTVQYAYGASFTMPDTAGSVALRNGTLALTATWAAGVGGAGVAAELDPTLVVSATDVGTAPTPTAKPCSATASYGTQMPQQRGTPGTRGSCRGYLVLPISVNFQDISTTGTALSFSSTDDGTTAIDVSSAPISIWGTPTNAIAACTNGWIAPAAESATQYINKTKPSTVAPVRTIAPFWDDLSISATGAGVRYQRFAAGQSTLEPRAHWIVQWTRATHLSAGDNLNFQVKFFDSGDIEYHYATMTSGSTSNYANGNTATVWLDNGTDALVSSINLPVVQPNSAVRFLRTP